MAHQSRSFVRSTVTSIPEVSGSLASFNTPAAEEPPDGRCGGGMAPHFEHERRWSSCPLLNTVSHSAHA
jgi:hypothetical protein